MTLPLKGQLLPSLLTPAKDSVCKCEVYNSGTKSRSNIIVHTSHTCSVELCVIKLERTSQKSLTEQVQGSLPEVKFAFVCTLHQNRLLGSAGPDAVDCCEGLQQCRKSPSTRCMCKTR